MLPPPSTSARFVKRRVERAEDIAIRLADPGQERNRLLILHQGDSVGLFG